MKNNVIKIMCIIIALIMLTNVCLGNNTGGFGSGYIEPSSGNNVDIVAGFSLTVKNIFSLVIVIFKVLTVALLIFAGARYMYASNDGKAQLKKDLILILIGVAIVFGAEPIISFVTEAFNGIVGN